MKAEEVLRRYSEGERDFRRANLRGQSFKGKDLSGADFSEADIRGTNFTNAVLRGANFTKAKAGLQKRWVIIQFILAVVITLLSGVLLGFAGSYAVIFLPLQVTQDNTNLWIFIGFVALVVLSLIIIRQRYTICTFQTISGTVTLAVTSAVEVAIVISVAVAISISVAISIIEIIPFAIAITTAIANGVFAVSVYVVWRSTRDKKIDLVRIVSLALDSIGGTSFRGSELAATNFTGTMLKSTCLVQANLTYVCWSNAKKLDRARVGDSVLANAAVRELLTSRNGYRKSYIDANLRGANLTGTNLNEANLKQADLSEALLQDADLREANLSETLAVGADFTRATLTGACLQAWNIDHTTKLDQVDCQFVFLLEQPNSLGSRERRPHDSNKVFEPGDFAKLYQKIMTTVQLLLRDGIHPEAFKAAFERLMQENPEITPDAIQAVERKGNDVLVTLAVPEDADKGKIEREWDEVYQARLEAQKNAALLEAANSHKEDIKEITLAVVSNLSGLLSNFTVNAVSESKAMSDSNNPNISTGSGSFVNAGNLEMTGSTVNLGEISGNVTHTINQLQQSSNPEAAQLADLLKQLQSTIEAEPALTPEDKAEALEQVGTLAKAGQNPQDGMLKKLAATAIKILKGTIASLPSATQTVTEVTKLVGAIATLLAL